MEEYRDVIFSTFLLVGASFVAVFWFLQRRGPPIPPGPRGVPVLGFLPWIDPKAPHVTLTRLSKVYGPIYSLKMGSMFVVVLSDHRLIRQALSKDAFAGRAPLYVTHGIMKGYGLICAEGELWRDQRRFVSTCLKNFGMIKHGAKREKMENRISVGVLECVEMLGRKACVAEAQDIPSVLRHCLGNVLNSLLFGVVYEENDPKWKWLQDLQEVGTKHIGVAGPVNFLPFLRFIPKFTKTMKFLLEGKEKTHEYYQTLILDHMQKRRSFAKDDDSFLADDIVDAFLDEKERRGDSDGGYYSTAQFHHLLADLFGAGLDTTLNVLSWFLLFMAEQEDVQKRIQAELDSVIGSRLPTLEDLPLLPYTAASLAEAQRIRSVLPLGFPHGTVEAATLAGYHIPKGALIVPLQWAVHMDPEIWPEPDRFNPGRFLTDDGQFSKPESFIPFQTGKRICVGEELGRMLLFLFGATIIHKFNVKVPEGVPIDLEGECGILLSPKTQKLLLTPRA